MAGFFAKCKSSITKAFDSSFLNNIANIILIVVVLILIICLMINPSVLIALALFGLFLWAFLYC